MQFCILYNTYCIKCYNQQNLCSIRNISLTNIGCSRNDCWRKALKSIDRHFKLMSITKIYDLWICIFSIIFTEFQQDKNPQFINTLCVYNTIKRTYNITWHIWCIVHVYTYCSYLANFNHSTWRLVKRCAMNINENKWDILQSWKYYMQLEAKCY